MRRGDPRPPRLLRAAGVQVLALVAVLVVAERRRPAVAEEKPQPKAEKRIRVVQVPKPKPKPKVEPQPAPPPAAPPKLVAVHKPPPPPRASPARPPPSPSPQPEAHRQIAADATAVQGVHLRVLVPRSPGELVAHLRNSGGCLVVSQLNGDGAEVLSVLDVSGARAVESASRPCDGVPRLVRDAALNQALGDPIGRARAGLAAEDRKGEVVLQVLLSRRLNDEAQHALRARFGSVSMEEMGKLAAASGYELTCFGEPAGAVRCE